MTTPNLSFRPDQLISSVMAQQLNVSTRPLEPDFVPLSVEELIMQCEQTMKGLDSQLRTKMNDQKARNSSLGGLGKLSDIANSVLKDQSAGISNALTTADGPNGEPSIDKQLTKMENDHPELKETIAQLRDKMKDGFSTQEAKDFTSSVDNASDALRSDNETSMISIQSIVSKRSQALQMTSNLVNSLNEAVKGVVQNIR